MDNSKNRQNDNLGVNKMGKNIRKSPLHQPNFVNNAARQQQPQPQVYNISKNDFRDIVQQLTGSASQDNQPRPAHNPPKPQSTRLQKIRPPPLPHVRPPMPPVQAAPPPATYHNAMPRPSPSPGDMTWANTAESPISAYMRYLQNSMMDPGSRGNQLQPQPMPYPLPQQPPQPQLVPGIVQPHPPSSALLPNPPVAPMNPPVNPFMPGIPPSPQANAPPILPSPTSQFLLPSPTGYMSLLSPRSPYPLLSPGIQFPSPFTPNFPFSPYAQSGILGPGPQPPVSPGMFPLSPSGFFPITSPRWRGQ